MYKLIKIIIIIILISSFLKAQQFTPDIMIEGSNPNHSKTAPVIDLDSQGNLGISWAMTSYLQDSVKFVKSLDKGQTFNTLKIVDTLVRTGDEGDIFTVLVRFDLSDNPIIFYHRWVFPFFYFHHYKKSFDGGISFPAQKYSFTSANFPVDYLVYDHNISFLAYCSYPSPIIVVKKSIDGGMNFIDSTLVSTGNGYPNYAISMVKCDNGDILCFYTAGGNRKIFFNRSNDLGQSFSDTVSIKNEYEYKSGIYSAADGNNIFIVYKATGDTLSSKIIFQRSNDNGFNFTQQQILYDFHGILLTTHPSPYVIFNPNVGVCVIWNQYVGLNSKLWFCYSTDLGNTFYPPVVVAEGDYWAGDRAMAVSDSGDVYIVRLRNIDDSIVLNKTKLPVISGIKAQNNLRVNDYQLLPVFPNPFNSTTQITIQIPRISNVVLQIYDPMGRRVKILANIIYQAGTHHLSWDGTNQNGEEVTAGIYFIRLIAQDFKSSQKILFLK